MPDFNPDDYKLSDTSYGWFVRSLRLLEKTLSVNVKVHDEEGVLEKGQIFLFNHFARFETVIPPYIIYKETGKFTRSIADKHLFEVNENFASILRKGGAVPNNLPGLLPFLAAEILKGRKVVIFPEGGLVKDRRVVDESGQFKIFSGVSKRERKHHKGAAVLALTLDLFKRRIKDLFEDGDHERIAHWQRSLGISTPEELLRQAQKPTFVVPSTITFNPIRITDNTLTKTMNLFTKNIPDFLAEELAIEGNILFEDTDMDIRFSDPISTTTTWSWWRKMLLRNYFLSIDSLDDLFGLKDSNARNWSEKFLAQAIVKNTNELRDLYMEQMYKGITVNLGHISSETILSLIEKGITKVTCDEFRRMIYIALKRVQYEPNIFLHESLTRPDPQQEGILSGNNKDLDTFLNTCVHAELVEKTDTHYIFQEKLKKEFSFHEVRVENPVLVSANEVGPIKAVRDAVKHAISKYKTITDKEIAAYFFDDELRSFVWNKKHFNGPEFAKINKKETATANAKPYLMVPQKPKKIGVLFIHGFLASPAQLREFAETVHQKGYPVMGVRLEGHGTSPHDLETRTWGDWMESVRKSYQILSAFAEEIIIVGFSAGGVLALLTAEQKPDNLVGLASVCTPLGLKDRGAAFIPTLHHMNKLTGWIPAVEGIATFIKNETASPDINYQSMPVAGIRELKSMISEVKGKLRDIQVKTLVIQATDDPDITQDSAEKIFQGIASKDKQLHWIDSNRHMLITDNIGETHQVLMDFIDNIKTDTGDKEVEKSA